MGRLKRVADIPRQLGFAQDAPLSPGTQQTEKLAGFPDLRAARSAKGELAGQSSGKGIPETQTCCVIWCDSRPELI